LKKWKRGGFGGVPGGGADEDEFGEEFGAADGGEHADHGGDGVADVGAAGDAEGLEDVEEVVDVGVEGGVAAVVEVVGVDAAGAYQVVEDDAVVAREVGEDALPRRLVRAEAVCEDEVLVAGALHAHVEGVQNGTPHTEFVLIKTIREKNTLTHTSGGGLARVKESAWLLVLRTVE